MAVVTEAIRHELGGVTFEMLAAWDDAHRDPRPIVLVAGTYLGRTPFEEDKARKLAGLGYVALAIDVYGIDTKPTDDPSARAAMGALDGDRALLRDRLRATLKAARGIDAPVDPARVAAIGYCFGGKCVLDLARSGADILAVASFHGVYDAPALPAEPIRAKVLVLDGWDDPLCPPGAKLALARELTDAGVDWQLLSYGHTVHAFTNPRRADMYRPVVERRSWRAMTDFLEEIFDGR